MYGTLGHTYTCSSQAISPDLALLIKSIFELCYFLLKLDVCDTRRQDVWVLIPQAQYCGTQAIELTIDSLCVDCQDSQAVY